MGLWEKKKRYIAPTLPDGIAKLHNAAMQFKMDKWSGNFAEYLDSGKNRSHMLGHASYHAQTAQERCRSLMLYENSIFTIYHWVTVTVLHLSI